LVDFYELIVYVVALGAILLIPEVFDIWRSHQEKLLLLREIEPLVKDIRQSIAEGERKGPESPNLETVKELVEKVIAPPVGLEGVGRVTMTLGVIAILGIAVIQLTLSSTSLISAVVSAPANSPMLNQTLTFANNARSEQVDVIKTLVTVLGGGLTSMVGFYFGTRAAQEPKSETTTQRTQPEPGTLTGNPEKPISEGKNERKHATGRKPH